MAQDDRQDLTGRLVDSLHTEAMLMADEARAYFDEQGRTARDRLAPQDRVLFACESLKVTTRLMHVVAWLLSRRLLGVYGDRDRPARPLAAAVDSDADAIAVLPVPAQQLIGASRDLHDRVLRLESEIARGTAAGSPARLLMGHLERTL